MGLLNWILKGRWDFEPEYEPKTNIPLIDYLDYTNSPEKLLEDLEPKFSPEVQAVLDDYKEDPWSWDVSIDSLRTNIYKNAYLLSKNGAPTICIRHYKYDYLSDPVISANWLHPYKGARAITDKEAITLSELAVNRLEIKQDSEYKNFQQQVFDMLKDKQLKLDFNE